MTSTAPAATRYGMTSFRALESGISEVRGIPCSGASHFEATGAKTSLPSPAATDSAWFRCYPEARRPRALSRHGSCFEAVLVSDLHPLSQRFLRVASAPAIGGPTRGI